MPPAHTVHIPVLESDRLLLRGHRQEDFEDSFALWSSPDVTRYIGGAPFSREEVWARLLRYVGHWAVLAFGYWVVEEKATGRFLGEVGFANFMRTIEPSMMDTPEIGWVLAPQVHGNGYATEAVAAALRWSDAQFKDKSTACIIAPENTASLRVAEKSGYRALVRTTYRDKPTILLTRPARAA